MKDDVKPETWFTLVNRPSVGTSTIHTSDQWNIVKPRTTQDIRTNSWSVRCVDNWNNLPSDLKRADTLNSFKQNYDRLFST